MTARRVLGQWDSRAVIAMVLLALALWAYTIVRAATLSITYDEGWTMTGIGHSVWDLLTFRHNDVNTHPLNTILIKVARRLLGAHTYAYRLPNVLAHGAYLAASIPLVLRARSAAARCAGFALLHFNPFLLDFFSLARGYGLALAFTLGGLLCLARSLERPGWRLPAAACACLALATLSNLAFLHALAAVQGVLLLLAAERAWREGDRPGARLAVFLSQTWGSLLVTAGLLAGLLPAMRRLQAAGQFYFGGFDSFWGDTAGSLVTALLYRDSPSRLSSALTLLVGLMTAACALLALAAWREERFRLARTPGLVFFLLLCLPALTTTALHHLQGSRFLLERTALLFVPLFGLAVQEAGDLWVRAGGARPRALARATLLATALILAAGTVRAANLRYTLDWRYDADVREVVRLLEGEHRRTGRPIHFVVSWPFKMPVGFYVRQWRLDWLRYEVYEYGEKKTRYDYCYLLDGEHAFEYRLDRAFLAAHRHQIVRRFPVSDSWLLRGEGP